MKQFYRRRLPHWQPPGATLFLTYRLYGSLPIEVIQKLRMERLRLQKEPSRPDETPRERALREGRGLFKLLDDALDKPQIGPKWLLLDEIATVVLGNLFFHACKLYRLWAFVIMPNHVHVLIEPLAIPESNIRPRQHNLQHEFVFGLPKITHALKSYTSNRANEIIGRGGAFWQEESFDHWIRNEQETMRVIQYIENNPVKAKLVNSPEKWRWSSAAFERGDDGACVNVPNTG